MQNTRSSLFWGFEFYAPVILVSAPPPLGPGIPETYRGLSAEILPPTSPGSAVDVPGFWFPSKIAYTV